MLGEAELQEELDWWFAKEKGTKDNIVMHRDPNLEVALLHVYLLLLIGKKRKKR